MACVVGQNEQNIYDDDIFSDSSTMKCYSIGNSSKINRYINSATYTENEIFRRSGVFESTSYVIDNDDEDDDDFFGDDEHHSNNFKSKSFAFNKICRIDMSPEAEQRRREAYNKWLKDVNEREKERKLLQRAKIEAEHIKQMEQEELKRLENDEKVRQWNEKKRLQAQKKIYRLNEMKQATERKVNEPREFKRAISYEEWVARKNKEFKKLKARQVVEKEKFKDYVKARESISTMSYKKWMQTSRNTAKPVPMNRGLESLRGSTTKLFVNPIEWKSSD